MKGLRLASPATLFAAAAACLLPLSILAWHSSWPPLTWKLTHFADAEFGQEILVVCVLFLFVALIYFIFPKVFRRRMSQRLGWLHLWGSLAGFFLVLALPVVFNLTFRPKPDEGKVALFFRAFGVSMEATLWQFGVLLAPQLLLVANLVWSLFKGERIPRPAQSEARLSA